MTYTQSEQGQHKRLSQKRIHCGNMVIWHIDYNRRRARYWAGQAHKIEKKIQKLQGGNND